MAAFPQSTTRNRRIQGPSGNFRQAGLSRPLGLDPGRCGARGVRRTLLTAHTARVLFLRCGAYPLDRGNHGRNVSSHKRGCLKPAGKTDMHGSPGRPHFCLSRAPGAARPTFTPGAFLTPVVYSSSKMLPGVPGGCRAISFSKRVAGSRPDELWSRGEPTERSTTRPHMPRRAGEQLENVLSPAGVYLEPRPGGALGGRPLSPPALFLTQGIHSHEAHAPRNSKKVRWPAWGEDNAHLRSYHPLKGPDSGRRESDASTRTGSDTWPTPSPHRDVPHVILCLAAGRTACRNRLGLDGGIRGWAA